MKETFKIKPPKRIAIGDPWYYETHKGKELDRLTVNFLRPNDFTAARVMIEESAIEDMPEYKSLDMTICLAPKKTIDTYLKGMYYSFQDCSERPICVDTAKYKMSVDGREDTIYTGADGIWGDVTEYGRKNLNLRPEGSRGNNTARVLQTMKKGVVGAAVGRKTTLQGVFPPGTARGQAAKPRDKGSSPASATKNPHSKEWGFYFFTVHSSLFTILYAFIKRIFGSNK